MLPRTEMLCLSHFILYSQAAWKGTTFWASEFESVPAEASSPSLCHHKGASQDSDMKAAAVKETFLLGCTFLLGYTFLLGCTFLPGYIPPSLNGFCSKQHLTGEQHVTLTLAHFTADYKTQSKRFKGYYGKD